MPAFAVKATPDGDKLRGGYYTPDPIASFIAEWGAASGRLLLEPSCGDGAVLRHLVRLSNPKHVTAVELLGEEASKARRTCGAKVTVEDFFTWFGPRHHGVFDGVVGNPPYIRFGSWEEPYRTKALDLMRSVGLRPTKLTNAWVPFVVGALLAVRAGGRIALVLPAELLQVGYAAPLRSHLVDNCSDITIVSFTKLVFPDILQEVVLLLAEKGTGPATIRTVEIPDAIALSSLDLNEAPAVRAPLHDAEKWTKYYLCPDDITTLRHVRTDGRLSPLGRFASIDVGVVTGRNAFFCLTAEDTRERGLERVTTPLVSRSQQLAGLTFDESDLVDNDRRDAKTRLLTVGPNINLNRAKRVSAYLAEGEADGVPDGYKCRIRRVWWEVPSPWIPDGFMLRQISGHPRLVVNRAGATSTDTVHRVRTVAGIDMSRLATGAYNSVSFALAEVLGRSYGGGILELEPTECEHLPVPDPSLVPTWLVDKTDELVRERRFDDALDLVDRVVLVEGLNFHPDEVTTLRNVWCKLRDRRARRGKRP